MNIRKENGKIKFEFDAELPRQNPYMDDGADCGTFPMFTGVIIPQKNCSEPEMGFAATIDMDYKGKGDQIGPIIVAWHDDVDKFRTTCALLGIDVMEYEKCANCRGPIYGCSTSSLELNNKYGGPVCSITCDE